MDTTQEAAAFVFDGVAYLHRYTEGDQHEHTPAGQEDLERWTDMVTINHYREAADGDALAAVANTVLGNYTADGGMIVRTDAVLRAEDRPAEYLIVAALGRPDFLEAAFARFRLHAGLGVSIVYSHRIYGAAVGDEMSAWLAANGPALERSLMQWEARPPLP